jgi:hypothetical protein
MCKSDLSWTYQNKVSELDVALADDDVVFTPATPNATWTTLRVPFPYRVVCL